MAFIERLHFDNPSNRRIFNVSESVGAQAANWWTDIQLVQYFIFYIYSVCNSGGSNKWNTNPLKSEEWGDLPNPNVDFKALKKTERWIRRFQDDGIQKGIKITSDGRVDLIKGIHSTKSGNNYTIHVLNWTFESVMRDWQGVNDYIDWALKDPNMPQMLKGQLRSGSKT